MATSMETKTRFEPSDGRRHVEDELPAVGARQGRSGRRVLTVLVAALVLAFIVWIPVEIWGSNKAEQAAPQPAAQSQVPTATPKSAPETPAEVDAQHK
jgi:flagellar biosynthesis/type III secretory pathway M-ring protein FliF/YscJ